MSDKLGSGLTEVRGDGIVGQAFHLRATCLDEAGKAIARASVGFHITVDFEPFELSAKTNVEGIATVTFGVLDAEKSGQYNFHAFWYGDSAHEGSAAVGKLTVIDPTP